MAPRERTLRLTSPFMRGADVARAQAALLVDPDGIYGPVTAGAAAAWKLARGYPAEGLEGTLAPEDRRRLLGLEPFPVGYAAAAATRADGPARSLAAREHAVARMEGWAARSVRERPGGSDRVRALARLAGVLGLADWYRRMGFPWCALAAFLPALEGGGATAAAGLREGAFNPLYCPAILTAAEHGRFGMRVVPRSEAARGDLVLFDWPSAGDPTDHLGRLVRGPGPRTVHTVDGNTDDRVARRRRPLGLVRAFVRDS